MSDRPDWKLSDLPYRVQKNDAIREMEKLLEAFNREFPNAPYLYRAKLSFAVDCGMKSFLCRYPVFDDDYYEVIILTFGEDSKTAPIIKVETFDEIFNLFRMMK